MMGFLPMCGVALFSLEKISKGIIFLFLFLLCAFPCPASDKVLVLCYHDIPEVASAPDDVPRHIFVKQLEYLVLAK